MFSFDCASIVMSKLNIIFALKGPFLPNSLLYEWTSKVFLKDVNKFNLNNILLSFLWIYIKPTFSTCTKWMVVPLHRYQSHEKKEIIVLRAGLYYGQSTYDVILKVGKIDHDHPPCHTTVTHCIYQLPSYVTPSHTFYSYLLKQ